MRCPEWLKLKIGHPQEKHGFHTVDGRNPFRTTQEAWNDPIIAVEYHPAIWFQPWIQSVHLLKSPGKVHVLSSSHRSLDGCGFGYVRGYSSGFAYGCGYGYGFLVGFSFCVFPLGLRLPLWPRAPRASEKATTPGWVSPFFPWGQFNPFHHVMRKVVAHHLADQRLVQAFVASKESATSRGALCPTHQQTWFCVQPPVLAALSPRKGVHCQLGVVHKIKQEGQTAGFGNHVSTHQVPFWYRFFEPQPVGLTTDLGCELQSLISWKLQGERAFVLKLFRGSQTALRICGFGFGAIRQL